MMTSTIQQFDFQALVHDLPIGVVLINPQGQITWCNVFAESLLPSCVGHSWRSVCDTVFQIEVLAADCLLLNTGRKVKLETSSIQGFGQAVVLIDVTQSQEVQERLNQAKRLQLLGNMCASLAHQIRNPLFTAKINVESLSKKYPQEARIEKIQNNLKAIEQEMNAILLFSRSDKTIVEKLSLEKIVYQSIEVSNIESKEIVIDFVSSIHESDCIIGNSQALVGVITNIISNAIDASEPKSTLTIRLVERKDTLEVKVVDCGVGIETELLKAIYEPFFTTKAHGTGLGLSIAKQVIENHQGEIIISSVKGRGTEVLVCLPKGSS